MRYCHHQHLPLLRRGLGSQGRAGRRGLLSFPRGTADGRGRYSSVPEGCGRAERRRHGGYVVVCAQ